MRREGTFCSPIGRSQSFGDLVPVSCDLHMCFSVVPHPPTPITGETRWLVWLELGVYLLPHADLKQAGVGHFPSLRSVKL